jgi:hypothetical protein
MDAAKITNTDIKPDFDLDQIQLVDISEELTKFSNPFPVDTFPESIQQILSETNNNLSFPVDYTAAGIIAVASACIGNSLKVYVKNNWTEPCTTYSANVGPPGANKTHPAKWCLLPLFELDGQAYKQYKADKKRYDEINGLSKKERADGGFPEPEKPQLSQYIVTDSTPESLIKSHEHNYRSLLLYNDELSGWTGNFNRYNNSSSESQMWLSNWSAAPLTVIRKTSEPVRIQSPFISVLGSIQPTMLHELAKDGRSANGFIDRICFFYPDNVKKENWTDGQLDPSVYASWKATVNTILALPCKRNEITDAVEAREIRFNTEAWTALSDWQKHNTDLINDADERTQSLYSKLEIFVIRYSLILQVLKWATGEGTLDAIDSATVQNAIRLCEYFRNTSLKVNQRLQVESNGHQKHSKQDVIDALPDEFSTSEGLQIAASMGKASRTFKYWLNDESQFERTEHGRYKKII